MSDAATQQLLTELSAIRRELAEVREKLAYREQIFVGWKEIAAYVGYSEDHCKELGQDPHDQIPHWTEGGRIVAQRSMLDAWLFRRRKPAQKRPARHAETKTSRNQLDMFSAPTTPRRGRATDGSAS